jgi:magnesium chelatase family protein
VLEVMRQPLEDRLITISQGKVFSGIPQQLYAGSIHEPLPVRLLQPSHQRLRCASGIVQKYLNKISGPLLDRIDIHLEVVPVPFKKLAEMESSENSEAVRKRVIEPVKYRKSRFKDHKGVYANAQMSSKLIRKYVQLDEAGMSL